eukprot:m.26451 g.26451  ORF g.26451 m.26451 type:complete len:226 (+) comp8939_c0_seq2:31-708(+)
MAAQLHASAQSITSLRGTVSSSVEHIIDLMRDFDGAGATIDPATLAQFQEAIEQAAQADELATKHSEALKDLHTAIQSGQTFTPSMTAFFETLLLRPVAGQGEQFRADFDEAKRKLEGQSENTAGPDGDEELTVQVEESFVCPMTRMLFVEPYTSKLCNHSFSKNAIMAALSRGSSRTRCPVVGCTKMLTRADVVPDPALQRRMERSLRDAARTQKSQALGDDDD